MVLKNYVKNQGKSLDGYKMRWSFDLQNDTVTYSLNPNMCMQTVSNTKYPVVEVAPCAAPFNHWNLSAFSNVAQAGKVGFILLSGTH